MPDFRRLVCRVYKKLNLERTPAEHNAFQNERFEEVLGSLSRRLADPEAVIATVSEILAVPEHPCLDRHRVILRLSRGLDNRICVVTTNFDTLLERAAMEAVPNGKAGEISFAGQALPAPGSCSFSGIVHIHGRLADEEPGLEQSQLVLTSADYGDAYMRSGWASRFLFDLARCKAIALVGYSAKDAPVRYFLNVLEADRARFPDLEPVYAFAEYESKPEEAMASWSTLAVTPLPYCKADPDTEEHDHAPLWRDLAALGNFIECPKRSFRERACAILKHSAKEASAEFRSELRWLFGGHRNLRSVALNSITDSRWFEFFQGEKLWSPDDLAGIVADWVAMDFRNPQRFECAREWHKRLGRPFAEELQQRFRYAQGLDEVWTLVWRLFFLVEPVRRKDFETGATCYEMQKRLESGLVLDSDLRKAVTMLAPRLTLSRSFRAFLDEDSREPTRRLGELLGALMVVPCADHDAGKLVDRLQGMPDRSVRILELATSELQSTLALETELELVGKEDDLNDSDVLSIESHAQNQHHEGVNFLIRVLVNCLPQAAASDRDYTRRLAVDWKRLPGRIGLRLCLHAMRNAELFDADEAMSALLSISDVDFWLLRRELALVLKDRAGSTSPKLLSRVEERVRGSGAACYARYSTEQDEPDWRAHARDAVVWLRLKMLQDAGTLSEAGSVELSDITKRHPYLDREVEEEDFFGAYISALRWIDDDPEPVAQAPEEGRLQVARELAESPDSDTQRSWSAFCRSYPQGAFDSLTKGDLTPENGALWNEFLGGLAFGDKQGKRVCEDLSVQAMKHLSKVDKGTLRPMVSGLCRLIRLAPRERIPDIDGWLVKLWDTIEQQPGEPSDFASGLYAKAIDSPAGKLAETLLLEIHAGKKADKALTDAQRQLIKNIANDSGCAGRLGRAVLSRDVAFLLSVDRRYCEETLGLCMNAENDEGAALRAVMLTYGQITPWVTRVFGQAVLQGVVENTSDDHVRTIAANVLRPVLAELRGDKAVEWGLTAAQGADALRKAQTGVREGALEVLAKWLRNDREESEDAWQVMIVPFFQKVWPKEQKFLDVSFTCHLIDLAVGAGDKFSEAFTFLQPYILPYDRGYGSLHAVVESKVPEKFPRETLDLIWLVCGPRSCGSFYEVSGVIDRLIDVDPDIEIDRRLQWLEQRAVR